MYMYNNVKRQKSIGEALGDGLHNIFGSGLLAIAGLVMIMASLVSIVACILPFWFNLTLYDQVFGEEVTPHDIVIDTGLFFMDKDKFINLLMIDKASSVKLMPIYLRQAQLWFLIGTICIITCTACAILLSLRSKVVTSAEIALGGVSLFSALSQVLGVLLCLAQYMADNKAMWQDLPVRDPIPDRFGYYKVLEAYPVLEINWGFFFAAAAALFSLGGAVLIVMKMCVSCNRLNNLRYEQLRSKPDDGTSPVVGYPYYANKGYDRQPAFVLPPAEARPLIYTDRPPAATEVDL